MRFTFALVLAGLSIAACQGGKCAGSDPKFLQIESPDNSIRAARRLAIDELYTRHPTRALVDFANVKQTSTQPAVFAVHIEMTGAPDARAIYDVEVSETPDGNLSVTGFTKVQ